ncbi:lycopene cyclase family protein [soil metagenome]
MSKTSSFDIIIAGAGASGLSLVWYLLQSEILRDKQILLLDLSLEPADDKTWCFWEDAILPQKDLIFHTWETLQVRAFDDVITETLSQYRYHCMRSLDYSRSILDMARSHNSITMLEAEIEGFDSDEEYAIVHTKKGSFSADWIFQSALKPKGFYSQRVDISLKQHFMGLEIETKKPVFDPDKVVLMDFDTSQKQGITFFYILPFSKTNALVEFTLFSEKVLSKDEYAAGITLYLQNRYGLGVENYTVNRTEIGAIPMEDRRYPAWYTTRVLNIGTAGGLTKPSTGYTFTRIHRHCKSIVKDLEKGITPSVTNRSEYRFRVYDIMFLYLLKTDPSVSKKIFHNLFKRNSFDRVLQFLEEDTHPGQELSIMASLPSVPFLKAIYKMKHRIFTGA